MATELIVGANYTARLEFPPRLWEFKEKDVDRIKLTDSIAGFIDIRHERRPLGAPGALPAADTDHISTFATPIPMIWARDEVMWLTTGKAEWLVSASAGPQSQIIRPAVDEAVLDSDKYWWKVAEDPAIIAGMSAWLTAARTHFGLGDADNMRGIPYALPQHTALSEFQFARYVQGDTQWLTDTPVAADHDPTNEIQYLNQTAARGKTSSIYRSHTLAAKDIPPANDTGRPFNVGVPCRKFALTPWRTSGGPDEIGDFSVSTTEGVTLIGVGGNRYTSGGTYLDRYYNYFPITDGTRSPYFITAPGRIDSDGVVQRKLPGQARPVSRKGAAVSVVATSRMDRLGMAAPVLSRMDESVRRPGGVGGTAVLRGLAFSQVRDGGVVKFARNGTDGADAADVIAEFPILSLSMTDGGEQWVLEFGERGDA